MTDYLYAVMRELDEGETETVDVWDTKPQAEEQLLEMRAKRLRARKRRDPALRYYIEKRPVLATVECLAAVHC